MERIGYEGLSKLRKGQRVQYKAGQGDHHIEAAVQLDRDPGTTGVMVKVESIHQKGSEVDVAEGETILAGANKLYLLR